MEDQNSYEVHRTATAARPLLGHIVLVVEDSRFASEAVRLLCLRSGARIRRADCLFSARRHLQTYRPTVAIVDLGLQDGSGAELISELSLSSPKIPAILGTSGDDIGEDIAVSAGADGFLPKPISSLAVFQSAILSVLPDDFRPTGPRAVIDETVRPDLVSYRDDMAHVAGLLAKGATEETLDYVGQFLRGVAASAGDDTLSEAAEKLVSLREAGEPAGSHITRVAAMVHDRMLNDVAI